MVEDAADDDLIADHVVARFDRQLRYFSDITDRARRPPQCQEQLRRGADRRARRRRAGRLVGAQPGLLRGRRDAAARLRPGRAEQPQPPGPLLRGRHRPLQGGGGGRAAQAASTPRCRSSRGCRSSTAKRRSPRRSTATTWSSTPATGPPTTSSTGSTRPASRRGIPFIAMSHFPPVARVGPLYVPGVTGCFACQEIGYRRAYPLFDLAMEQQRGKESPAATLGPGLRTDRRPDRPRRHAPT